MEQGMMIDRCMTGSVAEFVLTPIFHQHHHHQSLSGRSFTCHVQPLARYALYDLQMSVVHRGDIVNDVTLTSRRLVTPNNRHPYRTVDKYTSCCYITSDRIIAFVIARRRLSLSRPLRSTWLGKPGLDRPDFIQLRCGTQFIAARQSNLLNVVEH